VRRNAFPSLPLAAILVSTVAVGCIDGGPTPAGVESEQFALCSATQLTPTQAVSSPSPKQPAKNAIDGNTGTRWESAYSDPQWIYVDLGAVKTITEVRIDWQHAAAKDYHVDVSVDATNWSPPIVTKTGLPAVDHRIDDLTGFSVSARYVRVYGTARATVYGYSIWELTLFDGSSCGTGTGGTGGGGAGGSSGSGGKGGSGGGGSAGTWTGGTCASALLTSPSTPAVSSPSPKQPAKNAVDGNTGTRWESAYSDPQWIYVDLGAVKTITEVRIDWQHAAAKDYHVDVSNDATTWSAAIVTKTGLPAVDHRIDDLTGLSASGRYVRIYGTARATVYGYSIWELQVFGFDATSCASNLLTAGWDRSNVFANFTPAAGFTFGAAKNAISFNYLGQSFTMPTGGDSALIEFTQSVTFPQAGTKWRMTLTISGMNDQTNLPPRFLAGIGGVAPTTYGPSTVQLGGQHFVNAGSLTSGSQLTADFDVSLTAGEVLDVTIDNAPTMALTPDGSSGNGLQSFNVTDVSLVRLN
jgi:hypothetical protein